MKEKIERKFLVPLFPSSFSITDFPHKDIVQGYLIAEEIEERLRKKGDRYFRTTKRGQGKTRDESEIEITAEEFEVLWPDTEGRCVEKTRYYIPYNGLIIEFDVYRGRLGALLTAEVEFKTEEESERFIPPEWFGKEVTEDPRYKNHALALYGHPKD